MPIGRGNQVSGDRKIKAFVVYPERKDKGAGSACYSRDFWADRLEVRSLRDQLAENGVIAIAPDLLSGQAYADADANAQSDLGIIRQRRSKPTWMRPLMR